MLVVRTEACRARPSPGRADALPGATVTLPHAARGRPASLPPRHSIVRSAEREGRACVEGSDLTASSQLCLSKTGLFYCECGVVRCTVATIQVGATALVHAKVSKFCPLSLLRHHGK